MNKDNYVLQESSIKNLRCLDGKRKIREKEQSEYLNEKIEKKKIEYIFLIQEISVCSKVNDRVEYIVKVSV